MPAAGRICGQECGPASCAAPVHCRGLCRRHYRRLAHGGTLDLGERAIGSPAGHGRWGIVDVDPADGDRLVCHDCGRTYIALAVHVGMIHGGVRAYRLRHGLPMSACMTASDLSARLADAARPVVGRLAGVRSPDTLDAPQELITRGLRLSGRAGRPAGTPTPSRHGARLDQGDTASRLSPSV
jgi:hypothetical protein